MNLEKSRVLEKITAKDYYWFETFGELIQSSGDKDGDETTAIYKLDTLTGSLYVKITGTVNSWDSYDSFDWDSIEVVKPVEQKVIKYVSVEPDEIFAVSSAELKSAVINQNYQFFDKLEKKYPDEVELVCERYTGKNFYETRYFKFLDTYVTIRYAELDSWNDVEPVEVYISKPKEVREIIYEKVIY